VVRALDCFHRNRMKRKEARLKKTGKRFLFSVGGCLSPTDSQQSSQNLQCL
jgi:hypothetical protein